VLWGLTLRVCERFCEQIGTSLDLDWPFRP